MPIGRGIEWMSTIAIPTGPKKKTTESRNAGSTSTRTAQRRTGPAVPSPRWRNGIQAARPTSTTAAPSASAPVTSWPFVPTVSMWWTWRPPLTAASAPNVNATAERTPGRSESNRATASTVATRAMPNASACWVSGTPPPGKRKASSNAWRSARPAATLNTRASAERARTALAMRTRRGGAAHGGCGHGRLRDRGHDPETAVQPPPRTACSQASGLGLRRRGGGAAGRTPSRRRRSASAPRPSRSRHRAGARPARPARR